MEKDKKDKEKAVQEKSNTAKKLEECRKEREDYLSGWKRARADFLNYKKGEEERIAQAIDYKFRELLLKMLSVLDELDKAEEHIPDDLKDNNWVAGVSQIKKKIEATMAQEGVERMTVLGKEFNPNFHEALEMTIDKDNKSGIIIEVVRDGYLFKGDVLRPARVKVVK
jgi:molecular chaperone GrpE